MRRTLQLEIRSFVSVHRHALKEANEECEFYEEFMRTVPKSATFLATVSVKSENKVQIFCKEKCKTHRQFQR